MSCSPTNSSGKDEMYKSPVLEIKKVANRKKIEDKYPDTKVIIAGHGQPEEWNCWTIPLSYLDRSENMLLIFQHRPV